MSSRMEGSVQTRGSSTPILPSMERGRKSVFRLCSLSLLKWEASLSPENVEGGIVGG